MKGFQSHEEKRLELAATRLLRKAGCTDDGRKKKEAPDESQREFEERRIRFKGITGYPSEQ
ncbi:MAG: hypothetical protein O3A36_03775 [bacterium]|nr:hypothetical protein [bacterium]